MIIEAECGRFRYPTRKEVIPMGKGDIRSRRGKLRRGTTGKTRPKYHEKLSIVETVKTVKAKETKTKKK
jgi:ribosomal small subunit protein bTHX